MSNNFTINQFAIIDENVKDIERFQDSFYWDGNILMTLSMPLFSYIDVASNLDSIDAMNGYRTKVIQSIKKVKTTGGEKFVDFVKLDRLCFLWAAFLDETIINESKIDTSQWQNKTLVSELFSMRNSGDVFFTLVKKLMSTPQNNLDLLEVAYILLQLGFKGRYFNDNSSTLAKFVAEICFILDNHRTKETKTNLLVNQVGEVVEKSILTTGIKLSYFWLAVFIFCVLSGFGYDYYITKENQLYEDKIITQMELTIKQQQANLSVPIVFDDSSFYFQPEQKKSQPDQAKSQPEQAKSQPDQTKSQPEQAKSQPDHTKSKPVDNKVTSNSSKVNQQLNVTVPTQSTDVESPPTISETVSSYWVQVGAYSKRDTLFEPIKSCNKSQFALKMKKHDNLNYIGVYASGYQEAIKIANYFLEKCQVETYIKEIE